MGLRALPRVTSRLLAHGLAPDTPAAVVARGTTPEQQVVVATLATIADAVAASGVAQPATLVVGRVVALRDGAPADARDAPSAVRVPHDAWPLDAPPAREAATR
jgi:siroheme synthase